MVGGTELDPEATRGETPRSNRALSIAIRALAVLGVLGGLVIFGRTLDRAAVWSAISGAAPLPLLVASALCVLGALMRAGFWSMALSPFASIETSTLFVYTLASSATSIVAPFRAGEALRVWLLRRAHSVPLSISLSVIALEKIADLSWLLLLLAPLPWLGVRLPEEARGLLAWAPALPISFFAILFLAGRSSRLRDSDVFAGLRLARHPRALLGAIAFVGAAWILDVSAIALCLSSMDLGGSLGRALLVLLFANVASSVPVTPGAAGTHELASVAALTWTGVSHERAAAFALLYHAMQTLPTLALGLAASRRTTNALTSSAASGGAAPRE